MTGKLKRLIGVAVINVFVFVALFEAGSLIHYATTAGGFFYTRAEEQAFVPGRNPIKVLDVLFHPFFGYVHRQNPEWASNAGMGTGPIAKGENCCDLPLIPNENQIIIAVFGGSVARDFAVTPRKYRYLNDLLGRYRQFEGKEITVLNFTMSGYRQPQQLMMFAFYLMRGQKIDIAINIDGYNEVYHGSLNAERGVDIDLPAEDIWGKMHEFVDQTNMRLDDSAGIRVAYYDWTARDNRRAAGDCLLASCYALRMLGSYYYGALADRARDEWEAKRKSVSHFYRKTPPPRNEGGKNAVIDYSNKDALYREIAEIWGESSRMMSDLAARHGVLYIHMLQPNLYYPTKRKFEPRNPSWWTPKFSEPVRLGYPYMVRKMEELQKDGVLSLNVLGIFDDAPPEVGYIDDCCHVNEAANRYWWERIAPVIAEHYRPEDAKPPAPQTGSKN